MGKSPFLQADFPERAQEYREFKFSIFLVALVTQFQYALDRFVGGDSIETHQGTITDLPFDNESFDLVFTSGVLIHIPPASLQKAISEVYRCSRRYIWGAEYYAHQQKPASTQWWEDMLWEADFPRLFFAQFPDLQPIREAWWPDTRTDHPYVLHAYLMEK